MSAEYKYSDPIEQQNPKLYSKPDISSESFIESYRQSRLVLITALKFNKDTPVDSGHISILSADEIEKSIKSFEINRHDYLDAKEDRIQRLISLSMSLKLSLEAVLDFQHLSTFLKVNDALLSFSIDKQDILNGPIIAQLVEFELRLLGELQ
jgi:hypothetical protein